MPLMASDLKVLTTKSVSSTLPSPHPADRFVRPNDLGTFSSSELDELPSARANRQEP